MALGRWRPARQECLDGSHDHRHFVVVVLFVVVIPPIILALVLSPSPSLGVAPVIYPDHTQIIRRSYTDRH